MKKDNSLLDAIENVTDSYLTNTSPEYRKQRGQFFTPLQVGRFMVNRFDFEGSNTELKILDPGAGLGVFENLICEKLMSFESSYKVNFDIFESDKTLLPFLKENLNFCKEILSQNSIDVNFNVIDKDFIDYNRSLLQNKLSDDENS